ncbi:MAG TPA: hypothetical protein VJL89_09630 [Thermodesulfovibrionia bacterium]|nr:hypothetical protein [Thermodesulfovibrionia bacterium]
MPFTIKYPSLYGSNHGFRKDVLIEIGGFDEEFDYFLDETDVCLRIIDKGYIIRQLDFGFMHHKYAPSHIRNVEKILTNRYSVIKNKIYFSVKNASGIHPFGRILHEAESFTNAHGQEVNGHYKNNKLTKSDVDTYWEDVEKAWQVGLINSLTKERKLMSPEKLQNYS